MELHVNAINMRRKSDLIRSHKRPVIEKGTGLQNGRGGGGGARFTPAKKKGGGRRQKVSTL